MSALTATAPAPIVVPVLARTEARRLLLHPVMLVGFALWVAMTADTLLTPPTVLEAFEAVGSSLSWVPGIPAILAAYLVATRDRRAGTLDVLGAAPARSEERVRSLCVAALGPGLVALALNTAVLVALHAQDKLFSIPGPDQPGLGHLLQAPLTVVGACLLGTMFAVWVPSPVTPALAIVVMVAGHAVIEGATERALFGPAVFWADWGGFDGTIWVGLVDGSVWWHLVYVLGLCGMAASAAVVRVAERRRTIVLVGLVSVALAVLGGVLQLP